MEPNNQELVQPQSVLAMCQLCNHTSTSINYIWNVWNQKTYKIKNTDFTLIGFSVAALRTNFYLKELNIMFDGGLSSNYLPSHVFVTHLHTDHIANCPWHFNPGNIEINTKFYTPQHTGIRLHKFLEASHPYQGEITEINQQSQLDGTFSVIEVEDGKNIEIEIKGNKYILEIIRCYHTVRCTSYGLIQIKKKLRQEYLGLKGAEIKKLKEGGIEITENVLSPCFLYIGDTGKEILLDSRLLKYSTIMIECTFLENTEIERADETKHMHWQTLKPYILTNSNITFILYHFSSRYKREFINNFFLKENISNVVIWNSN